MPRLCGSASGKVRKYYYLGNTRVAMNESGIMRWLQGDNLGSASLATDVLSNVTSNIRYKPFGEQRDSAAFVTNRKFNGMIEEPQAGGFYDFGARMYLPKIGRFVSADTVVPGAGNPQAFNRYSFVLNNPLKFVDPSGHAQESPKDNVCAGTNYQCYFSSVEVRLFDLKLDKTLARNEMMQFFLEHPDANPTDYSAAAGEFYNLAADAQRDAMYDPAGMKIPMSAWANPAWEIDVGQYGATMAGGYAIGSLITRLAGKLGNLLQSKNMPAFIVDAKLTPQIAENIESAQRSGHPSILNRLTDSSQIAQNRRGAIKGFIGSGSPDEYPFASTYQGGAGAQVKGVPVEEQWIQGGQLSQFYRKFSLKDGDPFTVQVKR